MFQVIFLFRRNSHNMYRPTHRSELFSLWHDRSSIFQDSFILFMWCFFNVINFNQRVNLSNFFHLSFLLNIVLRKIETRGSKTVLAYTISGYLTLHSVAKKIYRIEGFYILIVTRPLRLKALFQHIPHLCDPVIQETTTS